MSFSFYDTLMELSTDDYHHDNESPVPVSSHFTPPSQTNSSSVQLLDLDASRNQESTPSTNMQTSMLPFLEKRNICLDAVSVKRSDLNLLDNGNVLRKDRNFLNMTIRSAVHTTGARSIKGFELHRVLQKIKSHVPNLDLDDKELVGKVKRKVIKCMGFLKQRQVPVDKDYIDAKAQSQKRSLPTDEFDTTNEDLLKIGNLVSLLDNLGQPIAKANVVAYPCSDMFIRDNEVADEWVSVMIHTKRRNSVLDFLPSNNAHQRWEDIGRNSFVSWPLHRVKSITEYNEFTERMQRERRKTKKNLQKGSRRRLAFMPEHQPLQETTDDNQPLQETTDDNQPLQETTDDNQRPQETTDDNQPLQETTDDNQPLQETTDDNQPLQETTDDNQPLQETTDDNQPLQETTDDNQPLHPNTLEQSHSHYDDDQDVLNRLKLHDYVEVEYPILQGRKKKTKTFYGQIINLEDLTVRFLRAVMGNTFVWPKIDDISNVESSEITRILTIPTMDSRERLVFHK